MRPARSALALACVACAFSCYEPPVSEKIEIDFTGDSGATVRTLVRLRPASDLEGRPRERVARTARALAEESDVWAGRIREMEPAEDRFELGRRGGEIVEAVRTATLERREAVETLFAATPVGARYAEGPDWQELTLSPDRTGPASAAERRVTDGEIERWAEGAAAYFEAATGLWQFVERRPERARPCFDAIFAHGWSPAHDAGEEEASLIRVLEERTGSVLAMFEAREEQEFTLSERVRRAYDPFPAEVTVRVSGEVLESEGFARASDGAFDVAALDLWNAFRSLEGRWISPDPAVALWKHDVAADKGPFDVAAFVALPRFAARAPRASEIVTELRKALEPAPCYRVRWRRPAEEPERDDGGR